MKKILFFLLIAGALHAQVLCDKSQLCPAGAGAGITLLTHCVAVGTGNCTIDTTGATLIIVDQLTNAVTLGAAPTENKSNTLQAPASTLCSNASGGTVQGYYIFNPTVGSGHIFTGHAAANAYYVSAYSGTLTTSGVFVTGNCHSQSGGGGLSFQPGSVTPTKTNQLLLTMAFDLDSGTGTWTVPTSFALVDSSVGVASSSSAYEIDPASLAINPTWTNVNNQNFVGNIMVFDHP